MSVPRPEPAHAREDWRDLVRKQLVDYGRLLALGRELRETLQAHPGPAKLKALSGRREAVVRSLRQRAARMETEGLPVPGPGQGMVLPPGVRGELRRALEAVLEVERECRKLHEDHLQRLRGAIQQLQRSGEAAQVYSAPTPLPRRSLPGSPRTRINLNG